MRISGEKADASCIASCITSCILDASTGYRKVREDCVANKQRRHDICVNAAQARWEKVRQIREALKGASDDASRMHDASEKEGFPHTPFQEIKPPGGEQSVAIAPSFPQPPMGEIQAKEEVKAKPVGIDSQDTVGNREDVPVHQDAIARTYPPPSSTAGHFKSDVNAESNHFDRDARFRRFTEEVWKFWAGMNPDRPECPWIRPDKRALNDLLAGSPNLQIEDFKCILRNRASSEVNPLEPPRHWLRSAVKFAEGPLDRYGKSMKRPRVL